MNLAAHTSRDYSIPPQEKDCPYLIFALEIGGRDRPAFHPNADTKDYRDVKTGKPTVDYIIDFEQPLPFPDQKFMLVFLTFALERISWKRVNDFIKEVFRITKPGGKVMALAGNGDVILQEVAANKTNYELVNTLLFGGQFDSHGCIKSIAFPKQIAKVFVDAGFEQLCVRSSDVSKTDMYIEGHRPQTEARYVYLDKGRFKLCVPPYDECVLSALWVHKPEMSVFHSQLLRRFVKLGFNFVDIGAHVGYYTVDLADLVGPTGSGVCIEPSIPNYSLLIKNIVENNLSNVQAFNVAASDSEGEITLHNAIINTGDTRAWSTHEFRLQQKAKTVVLDNLLESINFTRVNFIKLDIQGGESHAIRGLKRTIDRQNDLVIFIELWPYGLKMMGSSTQELQQLLHGFDLFHANDKTRELKQVCDLDLLIPDSSDAFTDVVCVKRSPR